MKEGNEMSSMALIGVVFTLAVLTASTALVASASWSPLVLGCTAVLFTAACAVIGVYSRRTGL